jgi:class 3 adenylate cyclase
MDAESMTLALDCYRSAFASGLAFSENEEFEAWLQERRLCCQRRALALAEELGIYFSASPDKALRFAEKVVEIDRHNEVGQFRLISLLAQQGKTATAIAQYQRFSDMLAEELGVAPDEKLRSLLEHIAEAPAGDLRRVTILYSEILPLCEELEKAAAELDDLHGKAKRVIASRGGHYTRQGADVLAYFGYPRALENGALIACQAALELANSLGDRTRIALHSGEIITGSDAQFPDLAGLASKTAARLVSLAAPGEAVMSREVHFLLSERIRSSAFGETGNVFRLHTEKTARKISSPSPFIGYESELKLLDQLWTDAVKGSLQAALIRGEAGVGKTRLAHFFSRRAATGFRTLYCDQEGRAVPLHPLLRLVAEEASLADELSPSDKFERLRSWLDSCPGVGEDALPLLANFLQLPGAEEHPLLQRSAQQLKRQLEDQLLDLLATPRFQEPQLIVIEDLHWADPSTLSFITRLLARGEAQPMFVLLTARQTFSSPWQMRSIELSGLSENEAKSMLDTLLGDRQVADSERIISLSDGVPLYIEELVRMVESGRSLEAIPSTLHDLLSARFEIAAEARSIAQVASCIGREFLYSLLVRIFKNDRATLEKGIDRLLQIDLIRKIDDGKYEWKHALLQETAYHSLSRAARQDLHRAIAFSLIAEFPEVTSAEPALLARHFGLAGEAGESVKFWLGACRQAISSAANHEAISHAEAGLAQLSKIDPAAREETEFLLRIEQGTALLAATGYGSLEVAKVFGRAQLLLPPTADPSPKFRVLWGIWMGSSSHQGYQESLRIAEEINRLPNMPEFSAAASYAMGNSLFWLALFDEAQRYFEKALRQKIDHRSSILLLGEAPAVTCLAFLSWTNWYRGDKAQAFKASEDALRLAEEIGHPHSLGYALAFAAVLRKLENDPERVADLSTRLLTLGSEYNLPLWSAVGAAYLGWALAASGDESGLQLCRQSLDGMKKAMVSVKVDFLVPFIESCLIHGRSEEALELVREGKRAVSELSDLHYAAELLRLEGRCLLELGQRGKAGDLFREAFDYAKGQGAIPFMLRAKSDLDSLR